MKHPPCPSETLHWGVCLLLVGILVAVTVPVPAAAAKLEEGQRASLFTGTDFLTAGELDLERDLGKRVILLDFGSIYCSSCMVTVPNLIKLRKKYKHEDLAIYNIYLDIYNPQRVMKFFRGFAKDIQIHLMIDEKLATSREYGVDTLPTTLIIDRGGTIRRRIIGYTEADEKEIDDVIERLIQELPVAGTPGLISRGEEIFTIFTPESFTKTLQDRVFVVGYLSGVGSKDVSLKLNNLPERVTPSKDNVFHFMTPLSLAMNLIEVRGQIEEGKVQNQSLIIFRETRVGGDISSELPLFHFHRDEEKKPCKKCHKVEVPLQDKTSIQQSDICSSCHTQLGRKIFTHGPITVGGCLPCHDYQSFPNKYELKVQGSELCFTCHDAIRQLIKSRSYTHGPVAAGYCLVCHDPHGSNERFLLLKKTDRLCINCHQDLLQELSNPVLHTPVQEGRCTACHDQHAGSQSKLLVVPKEVLCDKCHDILKIGHLHRVGASADTEFPLGTPVSPDGTTTCYTCHVHHAGKLPKLWRGKTDECGRGCHVQRSIEP